MPLGGLLLGLDSIKTGFAKSGVKEERRTGPRGRRKKGSRRAGGKWLCNLVALWPGLGHQLPCDLDAGRRPQPVGALFQAVAMPATQGQRALVGLGLLAAAYCISLLVSDSAPVPSASVFSAPPAAGCGRQRARRRLHQGMGGKGLTQGGGGGKKAARHAAGGEGIAASSGAGSQGSSLRTHSLPSLAALVPLPDSCGCCF